MTRTLASNTLIRPQIAASRARPSLTQMLAVWKQRRQLRNMDARTLDDLGITRQDAMIEANQPVWNVPMHWLK